MPLALTDLGPGTKLTGTYADTASADVDECDRPSYTPGEASSSTREYNYTRADDRFEETVAYAAITRVQHDFERLGFTSVFPGPVPINVHCVAEDTSFYSSADHALHMGDGGVDDAEDARRHRARARPRDAGRPGPRHRRARRAGRDRRGLRRRPRRLHLSPGRRSRVPGDASVLRDGVGRDVQQPGHRQRRRLRLPALGGRHRRGRRLGHRHLQRHAERGARGRALLVGDGDLRLQRHRADARHRCPPATASWRWSWRTTTTSCRRRPTAPSRPPSPHCAPRTRRASAAPRSS